VKNTLVIWNVCVTLTLIVVVFLKGPPFGKVRPEGFQKVIRTSRLELVDESGKVKAVFETDAANSSNPKLVFYNDAGREAAFLTVNPKGYATMYLQDKRIDGRVSVGYLWGSDTPTPPDEEDPLSSWGIRVQGTNGDQTNFGMLSNGRPIPRQ
jgi:hypothetical protein